MFPLIKCRSIWRALTACDNIVASVWMSDGDCLPLARLPVRQQWHGTAEIACSPAWCSVSPLWPVIYCGDGELVTVHYYWCNKGQCHRPSMLALWCPPQLPEEVTSAPTCLLTRSVAPSLERATISYRDWISDAVWLQPTNRSVTGEKCTCVFIFLSWETKTLHRWEALC